MTKIIFWQNSFSIHQAPLLKALSNLDHEVVCVTEEGLSEKRKKQGWRLPDYGNTHLIENPIREKWDKLIERFSCKDSVHIFSGFNVYALPTYVLQNIGNTVVKGIFTEPWKNVGLAKYGRYLRNFKNKLLYDKNIDFYLPTGKVAVQQFKSIGINQNKIFPFSYYVRSSFRELNIDETSDRNGIKYLFVGQLIKRKGVDILLNALSSMAGNKWELSVVGDGPKRKEYELLAKELKIANKVEFFGRISNKKVFDKLTASDYLILPSRFDGWGAVINEALTVGTKCIVSDNCGSSDLIRSQRQGYIFESEVISSLANILNQIIDNKEKVDSIEREALTKWAKHNISPQAGGRYLDDILSYVCGKNCEKPHAPWRVNGCV